MGTGAFFGWRVAFLVENKLENAGVQKVSCLTCKRIILIKMPFCIWCVSVCYNATWHGPN